MIPMRGINYRVMLQNWEPILQKFCEELTPHDMLDVICQHLQHTSDLSEKMSFKNDHIKKAIEKIKEGMALIDPER